jgi:hypothetical protein
MYAYKILVEEQHKGLWLQNSQNSYTTAPSNRELHHLQFSLQAASPETFGYTLVSVSNAVHCGTILDAF